jgi:hypothetical protein
LSIILILLLLFKNKVNNFFIERITSISNEIENQRLKLKQVKIKKIAIFKKSFQHEHVDLGLKFQQNDLIYSFTLNQSKNFNK